MDYSNILFLFIGLYLFINHLLLLFSFFFLRIGMFDKFHYPVGAERELLLGYKNNPFSKMPDPIRLGPKSNVNEPECLEINPQNRTTHVQMCWFFLLASATPDFHIKYTSNKFYNMHDSNFYLKIF